MEKNTQCPWGACGENKMKEERSNIINRLLSWYRSMNLTRKFKNGKAQRGRTTNFKNTNQTKGETSMNRTDDLPEGVMRVTAALSAKVISGTEEKDLGVISRRLVTVAFTNYLVDSLQNSTTTPMDVFRYHDAGTGVAAESNANTTLGTPWGGARVSGTGVEGASANIFRSVATITFDASFAITEHGLFSASTAGTLMDRSVFAAINVAINDSIQFTYELTVQAET